MISVTPVLDQSDVGVGRRDGFSDAHGRRVYHRRDQRRHTQRLRSSYSSVIRCWDSITTVNQAVFNRLSRAASRILMGGSFVAGCNLSATPVADEHAAADIGVPSADQGSVMPVAGTAPEVGEPTILPSFSFPTDIPPAPTTIFDPVGLAIGPGAGFVVLDDPLVVPGQAASWLSPDELVLGVVVGDAARAYPISQLAYHHIANDLIDGKPFLVTY